MLKSRRRWKSHLHRCAAKKQEIKSSPTKAANQTTMSSNFISAELLEDLAISDDGSDDKSAVHPIAAPAVSENKSRLSLLPLPKLAALVPGFNWNDIFADVSKLAAIERYLNLLYRPFLCFVHTKCVYNLRELNVLLSKTKFEPERHSVLHVWQTQPVSSLKIYGSGQIYSQGYHREAARLGLINLINNLDDFGYAPDISGLSYNVVNATFCMPFRIRLQQIHTICGPNGWTSYNPTKFPYILYEMPKIETKCAIFSNGYVYILCAKTPNETKLAITYIIRLLHRFKQAERNEMCVDEEEDEQYENSLKCGDVNFQLCWEKEFEKIDRWSNNPS